MTKEAALYQFFSGFDIPCYTSTSVPENAKFPYITYGLTIGEWGQELILSADVWYRTESEAQPNAKVREIHDAIGIGGITLPCDDGMLWVKRGTPWAQAVKEETDDKVKRRYLNFDIEYLTID